MRRVRKQLHFPPSPRTYRVQYTAYSSSDKLHAMRYDIRETSYYTANCTNSVQSSGAFENVDVVTSYLHIQTYKPLPWERYNWPGTLQLAHQ